MKEKMNFITQDKDYAPFLYACSQNALVGFVSESTQDGIVFWEFTPNFIAKDLIKKYEMRLPLGIPEKDISDAKDVFWRRVYDAKNGY